MKFTDEDIIRFAEDAMEEKEKANFEQVLALDPILRQKVQDYYQLRRTLHMGIEEDPGKEILNKTLNEFNQKYFSKQAKVISLRRALMRAIPAAAAAIIILFVWAPWKSNLYQEYSKIQMPGMTERGAHEDQLKINAEKAFNQKDFSKAAGYLSQIHTSENDDALISFYYGVALMQTDSLPKSREILQTVIAGPSIYNNQAIFFTALSYLREKDNAKAKEWLERIPADANNYQKVQELLEKIK